LCEGEWNEEASHAADERQTEDGIADASIYDGREVYYLDPRELRLERFMAIGDRIQRYIASNSEVFQSSDLASAIHEARETGVPADFSITGLPVNPNL
jgi:hypothetical protein